MGVTFDKDLGNNQGGTTSATSITLTTTNAVASNGFIVLAISQYDVFNASLSVSGGSLTWNVDVKTAFSGARNLAFASAQAPAGLASSTVLTVNYVSSVAARAVVGASFTGVRTPTSVGATNNSTATVSGGTQFSTGAAAATVGDLCVACASVGGATTFTAGSGWTLLPTSGSFQNTLDGDTYMMEYKAAASTSETGAGSPAAGGVTQTLIQVYAAAAATASIPDLIMAPPHR